MATIGQIIDFMNENRITWYPKLLVSVIPSDRRNPGFESYDHGLIDDDQALLFTRMDSQRFIGHYYVWNGEGNSNGIMLLPTNNSKYIKAEFQTQW